jgi:hypothetical protein
MPVALGARAVVSECSLHAAVAVRSGRHAGGCCLGGACWGHTSAHKFVPVWGRSGLGFHMLSCWAAAVAMNGWGWYAPA